MSDRVERLRTFVEYASRLDGDEKGEAQVFCDRLFQAFGHGGYKEAGATLEYRVKSHSTGGTSFADLVWPGKLLIEMKRRGAKLGNHLQQAFEYWISAVPNRPRYIVLCNFDEFWIYDFDIQIDEPADVIDLTELPQRYAPLNFLFPSGPAPVFGNNRVAVTREAADRLVGVFNSLVGRGEKREQAQRFVLQLLVALFAEDIDLLPSGLVAGIIRDCRNGQSSYDLLGALFRQMDSKTPAAGGRFKGAPYFNGKLFSTVRPFDLTSEELGLLGEAAKQDWSKVHPAIFGTIFEDSMDADRRHALGAHFTSEADILRVVLPTVVRPWQSRISSASTLEDLVSLRMQLVNARILDPACGSGNFLYVAYREFVRLEVRIIKLIRENFSPKSFQKHVHTVPTIRPDQFFGIDISPFGVELAKVTLLLAKKLGIDEATRELRREQSELGLFASEAIPLDNLDRNFVCGDALLVEWPAVEIIVGNPPFQSKNKMQKEFGRAYVNDIRSRYSDIPGRADYCVYWFRKAHDHLPPGGHAGLVGTNSIRQNYSRQGGLEYITSNGGEITEAVSSQVWSGDAVVHVSIVNWVKGKAPAAPRRLFRQLGDQKESPWEMLELEEINSALSSSTDVTEASILSSNSEGSYQGQTHGHEAFLLSLEEGRQLIEDDPQLAAVLHPYLIADELIGEREPYPRRYVIDFGNIDQLEARRYPKLFQLVESAVLPDRKAAAEEEERRNEKALKVDPNARINRHHERFLSSWWELSYRRSSMLNAIARLPRYIVCGRVTKRPIFEFVCSSVRPSDALMVFTFADDYSFGILQSDLHWQWFTARCSTLKGDNRYTSTSVFKTFPWPQNPPAKAISQVAAAAVNLRTVRRRMMQQHNMSMRELYRSMENPGKHPLTQCQDDLDSAVRDAYGAKNADEPLAFLLALNRQLSKTDAASGAVVGPGLPAIARRSGVEFVSVDCLNLPDDQAPATTF